jgi:hypothetical protein
MTTIEREVRMRPRARARQQASSALTPAAVEDARALALELAGLRPRQVIDPTALGIVLEHDEAPLRTVRVWLRWLVDGQWQPAQHSPALLTDRRLVARLPASGLRSFWWGSLVGLTVDLDAGHVILDCGDGRPRALSGEAAPAVAVAAVAAAYGVEALATHEAIGPLRS